jgi:hypothetical protein
MGFLKNFFNDETISIGLCALKLAKKYVKNNEDINSFNLFQYKTTFETNIKENIFLNV